MKKRILMILVASVIVVSACSNKENKKSSTSVSLNLEHVETEKKRVDSDDLGDNATSHIVVEKSSDEEIENYTSENENIETNSNESTNYNDNEVTENKTKIYDSDSKQSQVIEVPQGQVEIQTETNKTQPQTQIKPTTKPQLTSIIETEMTTSAISKAEITSTLPETTSKYIEMEESTIPQETTKKDNKYEDVIILRGAVPFSNITIEGDVYIVSTGVITFDNVKVNGNVYCYGNLSCSKTSMNELYAYNYRGFMSCDKFDGEHGIVNGSIECEKMVIKDDSLDYAFEKWGKQ